MEIFISQMLGILASLKAIIGYLFILGKIEPNFKKDCAKSKVKWSQADVEWHQNLEN